MDHSLNEPYSEYIICVKRFFKEVYKNCDCWRESFKTMPGKGLGMKCRGIALFHSRFGQLLVLDNSPALAQV
jgi:hypothetical protein